MNVQRQYTRREFLVFGSVGSFLAPLYQWLPWFKPKELAGAGARFRIIRTKHPHRHYLLIHGDEQTAREVLTRHLEDHRGIGFLIENQTRNIPIENGVVDPNRMFSRFGAEANLKKLNPSWTQEQVDDALDLLDEDREKLLKTLFPDNGEMLVALHNNSSSYSVNDEAPISDLTSLRQPDNPHAFFLCTDRKDYDILAGSPYNVVLQQHVRAPDDGSLSRRAAARLARYVNLEVRQGDAARQQEMLGWLEDNLP